MTILGDIEYNKRKCYVSKYAPGSIGRVFEYHERCGKDESGYIPVIIKAERVERKVAKVDRNIIMGEITSSRLHG